ncbi:MAG: hydroxymethylbilane synthase [Actinomycetaceae bacterium]|nr:hydroxymethylbilane synthase [Actinomycetaceae bacterium]MDY5855183.1 hydroxymethylbilane synthase [Arcanobacterium sp.]
MVVLRVGTRTSALALAQARTIAEKIVDVAGLSGFKIVGVTTKGDVNRALLHEVGRAGLFTGAVRDALLADECDIAVHSSKDLPALDHPDLSIAYPEREDPADVFCARVPFAQLPQGARIGTGSPRRAAQLAALRPDVCIVPIRGNVPTRLARVGADLDGVIVARAGLNRLGITIGDDLTGDDLPIDVFVPAAGQGALALEAVRGTWAAEVTALVAHEPTGREVTAERAFMAAIGAGCTTPVGVLGRAEHSGLTLHARYSGQANFSRGVRPASSGQPSSADQLACADHCLDSTSTIVDESVSAPTAAEAAAALAARFYAAGVGVRGSSISGAGSTDGAGDNGVGDSGLATSVPAPSMLAPSTSAPSMLAVLRRDDCDDRGDAAASGAGAGHTDDKV